MGVGSGWKRHQTPRASLPGLNAQTPGKWAILNHKMNGLSDYCYVGENSKQKQANGFSDCWLSDNQHVGMLTCQHTAMSDYWLSDCWYIGLSSTSNSLSLSLSLTYSNAHTKSLMIVSSDSSTSLFEDLNTQSSAELHVELVTKAWRERERERERERKRSP